MIFTGKMISPGMARGIAHVIDARVILASALYVPAAGSPQQEIERLHAAIGRACVELDRVQRQLSGRVQSSDVAIFESHAALLHDSKFIARIEREIHENNQSAEGAVSRVVTDLHAAFRSDPTPLVQDKASDILDIGRRLVRCLSSRPRLEIELGEETVIVAASLTPSELVRFAHQGVSAFITETCGMKSHTAILARGLALPLLTGIPDACDAIPDQSEIIVDATRGKAILAPTAEDRQHYAALWQPRAERPPLNPADPAITADNVRIQVLLNISDPLEAEAVPALGADGVGLFRTEFLYMDRSWWPTANDSYEIYRRVADSIGNTELSIRLVDFGAEKCPPYSDIPINRNPSLGLRGIRLLLQREDILRPQVQALARLARERPLTVMLPMLDTLDTLESITSRLCLLVGCQTRAELPFRLGTMIEVPAAAYLIDDLMSGIDSVSIGLNDLTQYMLAADRDDESVEIYHDALQPAVLRLVRKIVTAAEREGKPVTVCGELAGDSRLTGILLGMGIRRLSVSRSNYLGVLELAARLSLKSLTEMAEQALRLPTAAAVRRFIAEHCGITGS